MVVWNDLELGCWDAPPGEANGSCDAADLRAGGGGGHTHFCLLAVGCNAERVQGDPCVATSGGRGGTAVAFVLS